MVDLLFLFKKQGKYEDLWTWSRVLDSYIEVFRIKDKYRWSFRILNEDGTLARLRPFEAGSLLEEFNWVEKPKRGE